MAYIYVYMQVPSNAKELGIRKDLTKISTFQQICRFGLIVDIKVNVWKI